MNNITKIRIMNSHIDFKEYKLRYVISHKCLVKGLWDSLKRYNIEYNQENHELLVSLVNNIIMDGNDIEVEWTEEEYENFVVFDENFE